MRLSHSYLSPEVVHLKFWVFKCTVLSFCWNVVHRICVNESKFVCPFLCGRILKMVCVRETWLFRFSISKIEILPMRLCLRLCICALLFSICLTSHCPSQSAITHHSTTPWIYLFGNILAMFLRTFVSHQIRQIEMFYQNVFNIVWMDVIIFQKCF